MARQEEEPVKKSYRRMNLCGNIAWTFVSLHAVEHDAIAATTFASMA